MSGVRRRLVPLTAAIFGVAAITLAACGLPTDEQATPLNDEVPPFLANTTTTSTTTTLPTTTQPVTPDSDAPSTSTSTTTLPVVTLPVIEQVPAVDVYYAPLGMLEQVRGVRLSVVPPTTTYDVIDLLVDPPPEIPEAGLRSSVREGMVRSIEIDRGTATVKLDETILSKMGDSLQSQAFAQLVLTLTSFVPPGQGGIAFVEFTADDEPFPVIVPGEGISNGPVAYDDFRSTIVSSYQGPTTSTTTTTTTVTLPTNPFDVFVPTSSLPATSTPDQS